MRKLPIILATLCVMASCSYRERLYVDLPGTVWTFNSGDVSTWICFNDADSASFMQYNAQNGRNQMYYGPYTCDGHDVVITLSGSSTYKLTRTFFNLKRASSNDNYTQLSPYLHNSVAGTVWMCPLDNNLHLAYFTSESECVEILYENISREDTSIPYGWSAAKATATHDGIGLRAGNMSATLYKDILTAGGHAAQRLCNAVAEDGDSNLKGTVWTYNNTGQPADIPAVIIFNGKDSFIKVSGMWNGTVSAARVSPFIFEIITGTYSESGGTVSLTMGDKNESCPISGSSFTLSERTYKKLDY